MARDPQETREVSPVQFLQKSTPPEVPEGLVHPSQSVRHVFKPGEEIVTFLNDKGNEPSDDEIEADRTERLLIEQTALQGNQLDP